MSTYKKFICCTFINLFLVACSIDASIAKTNQIEDIKSEVTEDSLVLFNIAEVLMDTEISLGTQAWRKYVRTRLDSKTHDELTLFIFKNVPPKAVEQVTPSMIQDFQERGISVFAFTSRGRHEWYATQIENIDLVTEDLLRQIQIDFSKTILNPHLSYFNTYFSNYFHEGVIYTTNTLDKGELLVKMLSETGYLPAKIVFVDDKGDSLQSVENAVKELGIPFYGYTYSRTAKDHVNFDPMIAHIQLDWLITTGEIISDEAAFKIKSEKFLGVDPDKYFAEIIQKWLLLKEAK